MGNGCGQIYFRNKSNMTNHQKWNPADSCHNIHMHLQYCKGKKLSKNSISSMTVNKPQNTFRKCRKFV